MLNTKFGIEIEFTGITRRKAAEVIAEHFTSSVLEVGSYYDAKEIKQSDGRKWKVIPMVQSIVKESTMEVRLKHRVIIVLRL